MTLRALLVDDEPLARAGLRTMLAAFPEIEVIGEAEDGIAAVARLQADRPELLFLDVQMPGLDGFEVLAALGDERPTAVIFVTAYDLHALQAFEAHAIDYLLKPVDPVRLGVAIERARRMIQGSDDGARVSALLRQVQQQRPFPERLLVRSPGALRVVPVADILWIEADGDYARLHLAKEEHLLRETMSGLAAKLDPATFVRLHRSYFARIDQILELRAEGNGDGEVILRGGRRLPVSRTHRDRVVSAIS
ncbi:MAG: response regulator [Candidatus Eisenbacteria bacterium]|nr:response regulator [Candidatus Eisenbacteria bacterium]